ncbi:RidA family protein [bacterium]|nr:RidA family protein [Candidatus Brocadiia bacterium]NQT52319.1 RidA family protein [bacterium]
MTKTVVLTDRAPLPVGPYSQAIQAGTLLFVAGQVPIDPATGDIPTGIADQARQALANVQAVVEAAGGTLAHVVKTTVFLQDLNEYGAVNDVYATFFTDAPPARACVEVARLPRDVRVEVEAIAVLDA